MEARCEAMILNYNAKVYLQAGTLLTSTEKPF